MIADKISDHAGQTQSNGFFLDSFTVLSTGVIATVTRVQNHGAFIFWNYELFGRALSCAR